MATNMEQLVAAFAAMSGNDGNQAAPPLAAPPVHMEDLVAASVTVSGNDNMVATHPADVPSFDCQETTSIDGAEDNDGKPAKGEEACVLRVRFPDGRVLCKSFGAGLPTAVLFRYCRSALLAGSASARGRGFRVVKLAGGASDEVCASGSTTFRDLGLHHCTVHVVPD